MRPEDEEPAASEVKRSDSAEVVRRLEAVMDTALAELPLDALLDELLERVRFLLAADTAVILLREGDVLAARAAKGLEEEVRRGVRIPLGKGFAGRVAAEKRPVIIDDVGQADVFNPLLREKQLRALLGVPILFEGQVIGVLHVGTLRARAFGSADAQLLQVVADRIGLGIAYARLYEEERLALAAAERARAEAEAADRAKDEFLAVLSHELRSPLNALRTWASLLRTGKLGPEKTARALEAIERNVLVQTRLIDDLLDVSRIGSGKLTLELAPVDLTAVLEGALEAVRAGAQEKAVRLEEMVGRDSLEVRGDAARLQQVVWNLLSNAVKFSRRGGCVRLSLAREDAQAVITVTDEGEGIEPALLPHVFERFRQGDSSTTRTHGGLGLGLAIVQHLVQQHGGTVVAESEGKGRGARFTVRLPLAELRTTSFPAVLPFRPALAPGSFQPRPILRDLRILLVDDEPEARDSIAATLEACQASVRAVGSAHEALDRLATEPPDVLVADIAMPGEDGYSLIRRVRDLPAERGGRVPAVALTAFAGRDHRARALAAGFAAHLAKPVDVNELLEVIASLVGQNDPTVATPS